MSSRAREEGSALAGRPFSRAALGVLSLCLAVSCRSADREAARAEAARLSIAVERLRNAPNEGKRAPLIALEAISCSAEDRCELQRSCIEAYRLHVESLEKISTARKALDQHDGPMTERAAALVGEAQQGLVRAERLSKQCADLQGQAVRNYHL